MTARAGRIADAVDRIMGAVPATPHAVASAATNAGIAMSMASMAAMGMAALARLDPTYVDMAVKGLWAGGAAFGVGLTAQAASMGDAERLEGANALAAARIPAKRDALARLDAEVGMFAVARAEPEPDEAPTLGMR